MRRPTRWDYTAAGFNDFHSAALAVITNESTQSRRAPALAAPQGAEQARAYQTTQSRRAALTAAVGVSNRAARCALFCLNTMRTVQGALLLRRLRSRGPAGRGIDV